MRSGNQAGKTTIGAFCGVAMARGCAELDGVPLPMLGTPNVGVVLAKGRAMAKESVIRKYLEAIGSWPHHIERNGNSIEALWVKPNRSKSSDWHDWSCIRIFVEKGQSVAGMRVDWVHADEPPDWEMWLELRMRGKANRYYVRFITFTPIDKRDWKPVREDFKGCAWPKGKDGKVELVMSVFDNKALGEEHRRALEQDTKGLLQKAKLFGEYVDTTGANPFDSEGLKRWLERCEEPAERHLWMTGRGRSAEWHEWYAPVAGVSYMVIADPSQGIEDEAHEHDPGGIVVVERSVVSGPVPRVVARYNGYIQAHELGRLSRHMAERWNHALVVWERNSGYGEAFYLGLGDYGNIYIEHHLDARGLPLSQRLGWTTTATTRGTIIGALQKAILQDGLHVPSLEAVESLSEVVVDRNNRIEAGAGAHDEDMIVLGLACHLLETYAVWESKPVQTAGEKVAERLGLKLKSKASEKDADAFATGW